MCLINIALILAQSVVLQKRGSAWCPAATFALQGAKYRGRR